MPDLTSKRRDGLRQGLIQFDPNGRLEPAEVVFRWAFQSNDYSIALDAEDHAAMPWPQVVLLPETRGLSENWPRRYVVWPA